MENNLTRAEFLFHLIEIRNDDPDKFMELVLEALKANRDFAINEDSPSQNKLAALSILLNYFEEKEEYLNCAFIMELINSIKEKKHGKK